MFWNTLVVFQQTFFEATCISCFHRYPSAEIPVYEVFSHPFREPKQFLEGFKVFCFLLMKGKSSHVKKIEKYYGMMVRTSFSNVLFQLLQKSIMRAFKSLRTVVGRGGGRGGGGGGGQKVLGQGSSFCLGWGRGGGSRCHITSFSQLKSISQSCHGNHVKICFCILYFSVIFKGLVMFGKFQYVKVTYTQFQHVEKVLQITVIETFSRRKPLKKKTCKFKIDRVTYSKWQFKTMFDVSKIKQL